MRKIGILMLMFLTCFLMFPPFVLSSPVYENYLEYEKYDPNGWITVLDSTHIHANLHYDGDAYVYKDMNETDFFQDFTHDVSAKVTSHIGNCEGAVWLVSETVDDYRSARLDGYTQIYVRIHYHETFGGYRIRLDESYDGTDYLLDEYDISENVTYYLRLKKSETSMMCKIYNDSGRTNLLDTLDGTLHADHCFRYIYAICSCDMVTPSRNIELYINELDLCLVTYFVRFYHNIGGLFRVDNVTISNTTQIEYINGTIIELASVPQNSSYVFLKFLWDDGNSTTNPSNFMITKNNTIWTYFEEIVEVPFDGVGAGGVRPRPRIPLIVLLEMITIPLWTMWIEKTITLEGIYSTIFIVGLAFIIRFAYRWLFKRKKRRKLRIRKKIEM